MYNFYYNLNKYTVSDKEILKVSFFYSLDNKSSADFFIRPISGISNVSIYNESKSSWVGFRENLEEMPKLEKTMYIRVSGLNSVDSLFFEIRDTKGNIYETNEHVIWNKGIQKSYLNNFVVNKLNRENFETSSEIIPVYNSPSYSAQNSYLYLSICAFCFSVIIGLFSVKIRKWKSLKGLGRQ